MIRKIAFAMGLGLLPAAVVAQDAAAPAQDAPAQTAPADPGTTYEAARNQLGILQYCQEQGFTGAEAVEAQGKLVGLLQGGDEAVGSAAEEKGAQGTVSVGGTEVSLAEAVEERGSTVEATCQQIEAAVNEIAPTLPAG
ncbi:MAG: pore-forming ESAT-6 family protein [Paracoccus sp. (in: a-proteobacteria)]|jgi:putative hemolysin|uniref:pore-forming ESAT-6 family protein n=1 Tax=Paracoccus TaxID=265 RepID=UPI0032D8DC33